MTSTDIFDLVAYYRNRPLSPVQIRFIPGALEMSRPVMHETGLLDGRPVYFRATVTSDCFSVSGDDGRRLLERHELVRAFPQWSLLIEKTMTPVYVSPNHLLKQIADIQRQWRNKSRNGVPKHVKIIDVTNKAFKDLSACLGLSNPSEEDKFILSSVLKEELREEDLERIVAVRSRILTKTNIELLKFILEKARMSQLSTC
ncbi:hypothetical protein [Gluconobacter japonicus]|nr:hypothetical protein [Gluconobacter japonicus]